MTDLAVQVALHGPSGWINLEDAANGYELHKDTLATRSTTHRKSEISSEWVEGSFVNRAVRENVVEAIVVWVDGATPYELRTRVNALEDAFDQLQYQIIVTIGDSQETWTCELADYTMETSQEFQFATTAVVRATVPRLPTVVRLQV